MSNHRFLISVLLSYCKVTYFQRNTQISKKDFQVVYSEDAAVADLAALAGGKYLYVPPTSVKIVSQGDTISEFEDRPVGLPHV